MSSSTFRVVTRGLRADNTAELAATRLAALFKCTTEQIAPLLESKPVTVKKGLSQASAQQYAQALERCGCNCTVEEDPCAASAPAPVAPLDQQQLASILPLLRRTTPRSLDKDAGGDPIVVQPFAGDLEVVFRAHPDGALVRQCTLQASMRTVESLYELAVWNLYTYLHPRLTFQQMAMEGDASGARFFLYIETGEDLEASCLLLAPIWKEVAAQVQGPLRIVVPNPGTCLFCGADDSIAFPMMSDIASETWAESGTEALSELTYAVDGGGRVTVVPGAHLQRPAPAALPLRQSAQLVSPQLHAHAENAALLALSEPRLRRLQPQMFDPTQARDTERASWLERIARALAQGDTRAAVVVDAAAGVVASYTDELDCIVLLKFDTALVQAHGWRDGTRLLSANSYTSRDDGIARDLQPGPADAGRWGNVWPLLADLLTDDQAGLAARKATIAEAEWARTLALGRRALAERGAARDGRPLHSMQPAPARASTATAAQQGAAPPARHRERQGARQGSRAQAAGTFGDCVKQAGIFGLCAWAVWGAGSHVGQMPRDGLFYVACFGIAVFGAIGLASLARAVRYLRGV